MTDNWAPSWVADKLKAVDEIMDAKVMPSGLLQVTRKEYPPFNVGALAVKTVVKASDVSPLFDMGDAPQFVVNVPKSAVWAGASIEVVHQRDAAFGGVADLIRASRQDDVQAYRYQEYRFVERGLLQHNAVSGLTRLFDQKFRVHRFTLPDLTLVMSESYEISADDVRTAYEV
jgi:hypothetical protein